jgi:SAM-dependent methyltransferase
MVRSVGWDWKNADHAHWLKPSDTGFYLANKWKESGRETVLDLGSGLGRHAVCFAKHGLKVSAMDISDYGIQYLRSWAESENLNIETCVGDMLSLPYDDNSFDCVFAYHVISHSDTAGVKKIIKEIERVLKPQGEVLLSFCSKETTHFAKSLYPKLDENTLICQDEPEIGAPHFYTDLPGILDLLSGFDIELVKHTEYCNLDIQHKQKSMYYYVRATLR